MNVDSIDGDWDSMEPGRQRGEHHFQALRCLRLDPNPGVPDEDFSIQICVVHWQHHSNGKDLTSYVEENPLAPVKWISASIMYPILKLSFWIKHIVSTVHNILIKSFNVNLIIFHETYNSFNGDTAYNLKGTKSKIVRMIIFKKH